MPDTVACMEQEPIRRVFEELKGEMEKDASRPAHSNAVPTDTWVPVMVEANPEFDPDTQKGWLHMKVRIGRVDFLLRVPVMSWRGGPMRVYECSKVTVGAIAGTVPCNSFTSETLWSGEEDK